MDFSDILDIILGILKTLALLVALFLGIFLVFFLLGLVVDAVKPLFLALPQIAQNILTVIFFLALLAGMNVIAYFASYVWGQRKWWYFPLCLTLTIIFLLMVLFSAI